MTRIAVILGSTRPGRRGEPVAHWVMEQARRRSDAEFELVDLADYPLSHLDEPLPPSMGQYHSTSGVLKNAIDFLYAQWNNKAMGVVSYGTVGGARAAEHLRLVAGDLQMVDVRTDVTLSLFTDFEDFTEFRPGAHQAQMLDTLLGDVIAWSQALAPLRQVSRAAA